MDKLTKRALLIGVPYAGLQAPIHDVDCMEKVLSGMEFHTTRCCGEDATREGIIQSWKSLIEDTTNDDTVVIYYSGHGALFNKTKSGVENLSRNYQSIIPVDFDKTEKHDFRGILDVEISDLL